ncbi:MAG: 2-hydroxyacyl-CoA dehydratase family protein [Deltaproteobacteria bacterium]|jgi:benzoyl-CoA reductase/2-hydroxyglutaryl-CoA dehydratase subunit BcrC/BadD/HgdB|nr:2-hydroxyacyl-CoA dehydratase family protein [Deltaproteobacteria bacterium]
MSAPDERYLRVLERARQKRDSERSQETRLIREREDYFPGLDYFCSLLEEGADPALLAARTGKKPLAFLCLQAPLEIMWAQGFAPLKIYSGSFGAANLTSPRLPALACPTVKAILGETELSPALVEIPWVLPLTCDWIVKFAETRAIFGDFPGPVHFLEVPRRKESPRACQRFVAEIYAFSDFLRENGGIALKRRNLEDSIRLLEEIRVVFGELIRLRRKGLVPLIYFSLIAASFFLDRPEKFLDSLREAARHFREKGRESAAPQEGSGVFLSGSPLFFPNLKILHLLERAGLSVLGDDLCSGERIFPRHVEISDPSLDGLVDSLADAYHRGCLCPVFAENERRSAIIKEATLEAAIRGVVFHSLKGCHPYDLDSFPLEEKLRSWGLKFLKIETDYSSEDSQNLLTRLEAFRPTLTSKR